MKNIKISVIMLAMLSMIFSVKAYAKTSNEGRNVGFVREYIKGNAYKQIVKGNKNVTNKSLNVTVTTMYKVILLFSSTHIILTALTRVEVKGEGVFCLIVPFPLYTFRY